MQSRQPFLPPLSPFPFSPGRATPSSPRSPISRPRVKTRSKTRLFGLLAKEGAVLQSRIMLTISRDGKVKSQDNVNTCSDMQKHKIHCFCLLSLVTASVNTVPSGIAAFSNHKTKYRELTIFVSQSNCYYANACI